VTYRDGSDPAGPEVRGAPRDGRVRGEGVAPAAGPLTGRELLVLQLVAVGYSRAQIAAAAGVPVAAVEQAERSARAALGAATAEEAVERARRRRLIL
jgi:DNA-binding NarL/FixJ family response regulator